MNVLAQGDVDKGKALLELIQILYGRVNVGETMKYVMGKERGQSVL